MSRNARQMGGESMNDQTLQQLKNNAVWEFVKRYKKPLIAAGGTGGLLYVASQCGVMCPPGWWWYIGASSCIPC